MDILRIKLIFEKALISLEYVFMSSCDRAIYWLQLISYKIKKVGFWKLKNRIN